MIISKTPFRVSLFGGSTDYESFYKEYGSLIIGFSINQFCYVSLRRTPNIFKYKSRIIYSKIEEVNDNKKIKHNGIRGVLDYLEIDDGLEINHMSDLPSQTGIGSSSSFIVGLLNAIYKLKNIEINSHKLANDAIFIERKLLNEPGGIQDEIWAAYGGINSIIINTDGTFEVQPLPLSHKFIDNLFDRSILIYTGSSRDSFEIAKSHDNNNNIKLNIQKIANEAYRAVLNKDINLIAELLDESWKQKQKISNLISNDNITNMYQLLQKDGMIGGKLLGTGGNGFIYGIMKSYKEKLKMMEKYSEYLVDIKPCFKGSYITNE